VEEVGGEEAMMERQMRNGLRVYGAWAGYPKGHQENPFHCIAGVYAHGRMIEHQCQKKRGYGPDGLYCKQHAKRYEAQP
jgi:hypothetical protein